MDQKTLISAVAFAIIFLSALFLFMRNYPSDRWFSVVFVIAGGVSFYNTFDRLDIACDVKDVSASSKKS